MRVFVTGASGWIGSAVVPELINAGHQVLGLARSDSAAATLETHRAEVLRGDMRDLDLLREGARKTDAVLHLAYNHDFSQMEQAGRADRDALTAFAEELAGSDRPVVIASGLLGLPVGREATEEDLHEAHEGLPPRFRAELLAKEWARERGVYTSVVRLAPTVHGVGDWGFITSYVAIARQLGTAFYIGDGSNRWPAISRADAATLYRLSIERPRAGAVLHGAAEHVAFRDIAEAVGRKLDLPVASLAPEAAQEKFGALATFYALGVAASTAATREHYGWEPSGPTLLQDIADGAYTD
ncbi:SDR family oxidoreductase [Pseudonocardia halophobica]|uniref:Oxidoreductase n=1 Tax=Pseudonocardia halophobica TaxID=29401 RepID=A0A9W6NX92_9PSEU|nr:SDR family oxidoreductase [Pseudonocardia halophobica]GLL12252.1 oxidoreductase [Pseudonocardia halophobica]